MKLIYNTILINYILDHNRIRVYKNVLITCFQTFIDIARDMHWSLVNYVYEDTPFMVRDGK